VIAPESLAALRSALGADGVEEHPAVELDGVPIGVTVRPEDHSALSRAIVALSEQRLSAVVRGAGSRLGVGNPPRGSELFLSTERLRGTDEFEPAEGVVLVRAGTPVRELRAQVNAEGWDVPLDPPSLLATVGGSLAAATVGPRAHGFGPPRDAVLGMEVALATGERTKCGGRVVKNVTGYDMNKLYTGSFGTLGVIASAWLRLRPLPRSVRCFSAAFRAIDVACSGALGASRLASARIGALQASADGSAALRIVVELAGDRAAVDQDSAWLVSALEAEEVAPQAADDVRELQCDLGGSGGLRFRISALPSRHAALVTDLRAAGASILCYPGLRLVYAGFSLPVAVTAAEVETRFREVETASRAVGGSVSCESAPTVAKTAGRDMHGDVGAWLPLFTGLKRRFDPNGVLNPGRFAGGL